MAHLLLSRDGSIKVMVPYSGTECGDSEAIKKKKNEKKRPVSGTIEHSAPTWMKALISNVTDFMIYRGTYMLGNGSQHAFSTCVSFLDGCSTGGAQCRREAHFNIVPPLWRCDSSCIPKRLRPTPSSYTGHGFVQATLVRQNHKVR